MNSKLVDAEAERLVVGSMLLHRTALLTAIEKLTPEDFAVHAHRRVFEGARELARENRDVDVATISSHLKAKGSLESVGGHAGIFELTFAIPSWRSCGEYARVVRGRSRLRKFVEMAQSLLSEAKEAFDVEAFLSKAQSSLLRGTEDDLSSDIVETVQWTVEAYRRIEARRDLQTAPGLECGISLLDTSGVFKPASFVVLGARPSMGKTALGQNISLGVAKRGKHVFFVSIEMTEADITDRFIGADAYVNTRELERPKFMPESNWPKIAGSLGRYSEMKLPIWAPSRVSIEQLTVRTMRLHALRPVDLVVVDYLQLIEGDKRGNREVEVASISRGLKLMTKALNAPVLALCQLNRDCEKRKPPIPELSDLRESGTLEQDADVVFFLYRPSQYDDEADKTEAWIYIRKNRMGAIGQSKLKFEAPCQLFTDWSE